MPQAQVPLWEVWHTTDNRLAQQLAPSASNVDNEIISHEFASQRYKVHGIVQDSPDDDESDMFVAVIENDTDTKDWKATMKLNGHDTTFKLGPMQRHFKNNL